MHTLEPLKGCLTVRQVDFRRFSVDLGREPAEETLFSLQSITIIYSYIEQFYYKI